MKSFLFFLCGAAALFMITVRNNSLNHKFFQTKGLNAPSSARRAAERGRDYLGANHLLMPGPKNGGSRVPSHSSLQPGGQTRRYFKKVHFITRNTSSCECLGESVATSLIRNYPLN